MQIINVQFIKKNNNTKNTAVLNVNGPNSRTPKYLKKKWSGWKWEVDKSVTLVEEFEHASTELNKAWITPSTYVFDLIDIYRLFHTTGEKKIYSF